MPPEGKAWQEGKTAAAIAFVQNAERFLSSEAAGKETPRRLEALREAVGDLKSGRRTLRRFIMVRDFLIGDCLDD